MRIAGVKPRVTERARRRVIERLPARLNMPLDVREENGVLIFESRGYYFDLPNDRGMPDSHPASRVIGRNTRRWFRRERS